ncbi:hypothetical protein AR275_19215, partial [Stenotrophomonas maltophilia]
MARIQHGQTAALVHRIEQGADQPAVIGVAAARARYEHMLFGHDVRPVVPELAAPVLDLERGHRVEVRRSGRAVDGRRIQPCATCVRRARVEQRELHRADAQRLPAGLSTTQVQMQLDQAGATVGRVCAITGHRFLHRRARLVDVVVAHCAQHDAAIAGERVAEVVDRRERGLEPLRLVRRILGDHRDAHRTLRC